ncbi:hypothetical protein [Candidatus Poriferisodalis sp.]
MAGQQARTGRCAKVRVDDAAIKFNGNVALVTGLVRQRDGFGISRPREIG